MTWLTAPNLDFPWLMHGFGDRYSTYPGGLTTVQQIHSGIVIDAAGRVGENCGEGDALVSGKPGVIVAVKTADCVPVLLVDPVRRAVAALHAGWRGSAENIVAAAVNRMREEFGTKPEEIRAAIGPCIGGCCYEVSPEVAHRFGTWVSEWNTVEIPTRIDLVRVNRMQLEQAGVSDIWEAGLCTRCEGDKFWSFRRDGEKAGRMFSFIGQR